MASLENIHVLRTKFCAPNLTSDLVTRNRLTELLDGSQEVPLTLVSAPAGYGKSVVVSQWLDKYAGLGFWLSLDNADSNLRRFSVHLVTNLQSQLPDHFQSTEKLLSATEQFPVSTLSDCLLNDLFRLNRSCTIVLDDYHLLGADSTVHELLEAFLEHPAPTAHIILITRSDPPLRLIRYRAANELLEVREVDLRFNDAESTRLILNLTGNVPSDETLVNLGRQIEGWAVGLRLISLVLNKAEDPEAFLNSLKGRMSSAREYLLSEVVAGLDASIRDLLLKSSLLDRFCVELLEYVCIQHDSETDGPEVGASEFIDLLRRENLFVISLDNLDRWYRFHHLFQWLLQKELSYVAGKDVVAGCHLRASQWFENRRLPDEAIKHALLAGDSEYAAGIVERHSYAALESDQWYVVNDWLSHLSTELIQKRPKLLLVQAWAANFQQQMERLDELLQIIIPLLKKKQGREEHWGEVDFFRGYLNFWDGDFKESLRLLSRAQGRIAESKHMMVAEADLHLAITIYMDGRKDDAIRMVDNQMRLHGVHQLARRFAALAFIRALSGELGDLRVVANRMLALEVSMRSPLTDSWTHFFLGLAALHNFRLERAIHSFGQILDEPYLLDRRAAIDAYAGLALAQQLKGQPEHALDTINGFANFVHEHMRPEELAIMHSCRTRIGLLQGIDQGQLAGHYPVQDTPGIFDLFLWVETPAMSRARMLLSEGSEQSLADAQALIDEVRRLCLANYLTSQLIEVEVLQTLLYQRLGREEAALEALGETLALAKPGGWVRPFVEAGETMTDLLEGYRANNDDDFLSQVLSACRASTTTSGQAQDHALKSPAGRTGPTSDICDLTNRELDILELLAQRLQNKEIAGQLYISTHTVKDHLKHIYQKLDVNNRRQAILRAVELDLIKPD